MCRVQFLRVCGSSDSRRRDGYHCGRCPSGSDERNYLYEAAVHDFKFPCKYEQFGCQKQCFFGPETEDHEATCEKLPFRCPMFAVPTCEWEGTTDDCAFYEHCKAQHAMHVLDKPVVDVDVKSNVQQRKVFLWQNVCYFLMVACNRRNCGLSVLVAKVAPNVISDKHECSLRITSKDKSRFVEENGKLVCYQTKDSIPFEQTTTFKQHILQYISFDADVVVLEVLLQPKELVESAAPTSCTNEVKEDSQCAKCSKTALERFWKCCDDHVLCTICVNKCARCIICNKDVDIYSNCSLMQDDVYYCCRYVMFGCRFVGMRISIEPHESICLYDCPFEEIKIAQPRKQIGFEHDVWAADTPFTLDNKYIQDSYDNGKCYFVFIKYRNKLYKMLLKADKNTNLVYISVLYIDKPIAEYFSVSFNDISGMNAIGTCFPFTRSQSYFNNCVKISWIGGKNLYLTIDLFDLFRTIDYTEH